MGTTQVTAMLKDALPVATPQPKWNSNPATDRTGGFERLLEGRGTARDDASAEPSPRRDNVTAPAKQRRDEQARKAGQRQSAATLDSADDTRREETSAEVETGKRTGEREATGKGIGRTRGEEVQEKPQNEPSTAMEGEGNQAALAVIASAEAAAEVAERGIGDDVGTQSEAITVTEVEPALAASCGKEVREEALTAGLGDDAAAGTEIRPNGVEKQADAKGNTAEGAETTPLPSPPGWRGASTHGPAKDEPPGLARAAAVIEENRERQSLKRLEGGGEEQPTPPQTPAGAEGADAIPSDAKLNVEVKKEAEPQPVALQKGDAAEAAASQPAAGKEEPQQPETKEGTLEVAAGQETRQRDTAAEQTVEDNLFASQEPAAANAARKGVGQEAGGKGSDEATGGDRQQEKGQVKPEGQVAATAFTIPTSGADGTAPEAKAATGRSALHESILSQVKEGVVSHDGKGNGQMSIRLRPDELGELKIQVRMEDNRLRVEVQADNRAVKDLLMSNLDSLKEALSGKNLAMEGFNVSTGGGFDNALPGQREGSRQMAPRMARSGYQDEGAEGRVVNYLTAEVNSLLDVRF